jgi:hypothetical protein
MRRLLVTTAVATVLGMATLFRGAPDATATELSAFLAEVEEAGQTAAPARADFRVRVQQGGAERRYDGVLAYAGANVFIEIGDPVVRARMRGGETEILAAAPAGSGEWKRGTAYDALAETMLIPDDFRPFRPATLKMAQIVSDEKQKVLVSGAPAETSPWVLIVHLFDRDKRSSIRTQYYERMINNMVRMRRHGELVRIGNVWRPRQLEVEDYRVGASTTVELEWQSSPTLPAGLFDGAAGGLPSLRKQP